MAQDKFNAKADTTGLSSFLKNQYMEKIVPPTLEEIDLKQRTLGLNC